MEFFLSLTIYTFIGSRKFPFIQIASTIVRIYFYFFFKTTTKIYITNGNHKQFMSSIVICEALQACPLLFVDTKHTKKNISMLLC